MSARKLAEQTQATFRLVECVCPDDIIRLRLENRILESGEPSDGRWELFSLQKSAFDEIRENEREYHRKWDSTTPAGAFLKSLVIDLICAR